MRLLMSIVSFLATNKDLLSVSEERQGEIGKLQEINTSLILKLNERDKALTSSINKKSQLSKLEKDVNDKQRRDEVKHKLY